MPHGITRKGDKKFFVRQFRFIKDSFQSSLLSESKAEILSFITFENSTIGSKFSKDQDDMTLIKILLKYWLN